MGYCSGMALKKVGKITATVAGKWIITWTGYRSLSLWLKETTGLNSLWIAYAFSLGLGFVSLQTLSYYGYVKVDHVAIKKDFQNMLDLNEDGKIDGEDGKIAKTKILEVLQFNMPAGGGFVAGFVGGLRSG